MLYRQVLDKMKQVESDSHILMSNEERLKGWIRQDPVRMRALQLVQTLNLPQGFIAAGFVRNLVWDKLHGIEQNRPLADIDVIYFNPNDISETADQAYELELRELAPELPWSVKNQARMHIRNGDTPYLSSLDAMGYWPELETAVAVSIDPLIDSTDNFSTININCHAVFGIEKLFNLTLSPNRNRSLALFEKRLKEKGWLDRYAKLTVQR